MFFRSLTSHRTAKTDLPDPAGTGETLRRCASDEQHAKQQLAREWSRFADANKAQCIKETNIDETSSYVELRVCLQMASAALVIALV